MVSIPRNFRSLLKLRGKDGMAEEIPLGSDPRKYHKFLTDRERLIGKELLRHGILESRLSTS